jgi:amino acid adenylation domain-containing protein
MAVVVLGPTVVDQVSAVASAEPERLAVHAADGTLTYGELEARADVVARQLQSAGVAPGAVVGLCVERSVGLVVGGLGVLRAGCAYVAIDPRYPDDRIRWMLQDAGAAAGVFDEGTRARIGPDARPAVVLGPGGKPFFEGQADASCHPAHPGPGDLAYVVYTSGSTGRPKGVAVDHASLANLIAWHNEAFSLEAADRCTQMASPGFDAAIWEIWPSLAAGASVHVVPEELRTDPVGLRDWLVAKQVTVSFIPTAVAEGMVRLAWPDRTALRYLLTGGDALGVRPRPGLPFALVNNYGLSETTVVATSGVIDSEGDGPPSIGRPIAGVRAEVLDAGLRPVAPGEPGELVIGGVAVARGYLNQPQLTSERFVVIDGVRRYRTGDLVRQRADGAFDFLGRLDDQLSIRGYRVEPGEVTAALNAHPAIAASVVVGAGGTGAERQLVAYVVAVGDERPDRFVLADFLRGTLPEYLVPGRFVWLEEIPLTPHGKVDKAALPAPAEEPLAGGDHPPRTPTEEKIGAVLTDLLDVGEVGPEENFFLLGGHSMLGAQLIVRIEDLFDVELSLRYLFDHPTLAEIAAAVDRLADEDAVAVAP